MKLPPGPLLGLLAILCGSVSAAQGATAADALRVAGELPEVFLRVPTDLPRAEPGSWSPLGPAVAEGLPPAELAVLREAEEAFYAGLYAAALTGFYRVLEDAPDYPPALLDLSVVYFRLRRYEDLIAVQGRVLEVWPTEVGRTKLLGHALYSLGRYEQARAHYLRVIAERPEDLEVRRGLALAHLRLGEQERALELLRGVLEQDPDHGDARLWVAQILYDRGDSEAALGEVERARELLPYEPRPLFLTTRVLIDLGRDDEAVATQLRWRELDRVAQELRAIEGQLLFAPTHFGLLGRLVEQHSAVGDAPRTRAALERWIAARPAAVPLVEVWIRALDVLEGLGDGLGAARAAAGLEGSCPDDPRTWRRLALYFARTGDERGQNRAARRLAELR